MEAQGRAKDVQETMTWHAAFSSQRLPDPVIALPTCLTPSLLRGVFPRFALLGSEPGVQGERAVNEDAHLHPNIRRRRANAP